METKETRKFTRRRCRDSYRALGELGKIDASVNFGYGIGRDADFLEPMFRNVLKQEKKTETVQEFDRLRDKIVIKHAMKDKDGKPILVKGQYLVSDQEFETEVASLREDERFKAAIEEHEKKVKELEETLDSEEFAEEIEVYLIDWKHAPRLLPGNLVRYLSQFMKGEPPDFEELEARKERERIAKAKESKA